MKKVLLISVSVLALFGRRRLFAGSDSSDVEQIGSTLTANVNQTIGGPTALLP